MSRTEETIFAEAVAIAGDAERAAYLDRACAGRPDVRAAVEELLSAYHRGAFLERPIGLPGGHAATAAFGPAEVVGEFVGPYRLMEPIGEGGMGLVFVAEQQEPVRRKVAVKVIKPGMDSRQVVARFEAERQALADALTVRGSINAFTPGGTYTFNSGAQSIIFTGVAALGPTVSVTATGSEGGTDGNIVFARTGNLSQPLTVNFTVGTGSTATFGSGYTFVPG